MDNLVKHIHERRLEQEAGKWQKMYWCIDLHGTIIPPSREHKDILKPYPHALSVLKKISEIPEQVIILWTSTDSERIWNTVVPYLKENGVTVHYFNENPETQSKSYARFTGKFYFDILIDDKAGFDPTTQWKSIDQELKYWHKQCDKCLGGKKLWREHPEWGISTIDGQPEGELVDCVKCKGIGKVLIYPKKV